MVNDAVAGRRAKHREHARKYREANRELLAAKQREYAAARPEHLRAYIKAYRKKNPEKLRALHKAWYQANREQQAVSKKVRYEQNPGPAIARAASRKARQKAAPGAGWQAADVKAQYAAQEGRCFYCKRALGTHFHRDHIIPLARGGHHCRSNLALACAACNLSKQDKGPQEFAGILL